MTGSPTAIQSREEENSARVENYNIGYTRGVLDAFPWVARMIAGQGGADGQRAAGWNAGFAETVARARASTLADDDADTAAAARQRRQYDEEMHPCATCSRSDCGYCEFG